jgi:uncharacterized membrane protein YciS (DUF1049 family)
MSSSYSISIIFIVVLFLVCLTIGWLIAVFGIKRKTFKDKKLSEKNKENGEKNDK